MPEHLHTSDGRLRVWDTFRDVTPDELFSYWTEPDKLTRWWPNEVEINPAPGGRYRYGFAKTGHVLSGTFTELEPGQRLVFSWHWEHEAQEQRVVADFERRDKDTLLTVTQGPYGVGEAGERERRSQLEGWSYFLGRLKTAVR